MKTTPAQASRLAPSRIWAGLALLVVCQTAPPLTAADQADPFTAQRQRMVERQIRQRDVTNALVLRAMQTVPRHEFGPAQQRALAYTDQPLPIGHGQTISQPYIVALMTELLDLRPEHKVLEIGTGSGYQAAILAQITTNVYTMEIVEPLAKQAEQRLLRHGFRTNQVRSADGYFGLPEQAPFDVIIVTAAADHIPPPLLKQLRPGGRMVIPVGSVGTTQRLVLVEKNDQGEIHSKTILPVSFVPLTGGPRSDEQP